MALHPTVQKMIEGARAAGRPALSAGSPQQARDMVAAIRGALGTGPEVGSIRDLSIPGRAGRTAARLYRAPGESEPGLVVYLHGGGWLCGCIDDFDILTRALAAQSGCAVLSVDYRLAPEHPFPAGLEDAEDALLWAQAQLQDLIGSAGRLVVAGDSAGANLATVAAFRLRHRLNLALQCLFYPVTDSNFSRPSYLAHGQGLPLTTADMEWFFAHYAPQTLWKHPDIAPLQTPDLSGCAPAWIAAAEYDVLHDEAIEYAERLRDAGIPVTLERVEGLPHGFARMINLLAPAASVVNAAAHEIRRRCTEALVSRQAPSGADS